MSQPTRYRQCHLEKTLDVGRLLRGDYEQGAVTPNEIRSAYDQDAWDKL